MFGDQSRLATTNETEVQAGAVGAAETDSRIEGK